MPWVGFSWEMMPAVQDRKGIYTLMELKTLKEDMNSKNWNSMMKKRKNVCVFSITRCQKPWSVWICYFPLLVTLLIQDFWPHCWTECDIAVQALPSSTWFQHALCQRLSVEGVRGGVQQVPQDDGAVHDGARGQSHGVSHQGVHQRVYRDKASGILIKQ